jgi:hypothetical protein
MDLIDFAPKKRFSGFRRAAFESFKGRGLAMAGIVLIIKITELLAIIFAKKNNCVTNQNRATKKIEVFFFFFFSDWLSQLFFSKIIANNSRILIISSILNQHFLPKTV